jgi:predicted small lipoprotein YifL
MKFFNRGLIFVLVFIFIISLAACGNKAPVDIGEFATETAGSSNTTENTHVNLPAPDPNSGIEDLLGTWVEINDTTRLATITKNGEDYQYEDNDSKYPAIFEDGLIGVKVSDTEVADVFYDAASGNLIMSFQGTETRFKRK